MTPIAAEGLTLPPPLADLVAADAAGLAALICRLHASPRRARTAARAGQALIRNDFAEAAIAEALQAAIGPTPHLVTAATAG